MTLLVVKFELSDDFRPTSAAELVSALLSLGGTFTAYVVTFLVLELWLARGQRRSLSGRAALTLGRCSCTTCLLNLASPLVRRRTERV
jgi:hypothetical protein